MATKSTTTVTTTTVTLDKDHTHKGKAYAKGDKIEVTTGIAEWMYANGVATDTSAAAAKESK